jgi:hypothetical protein
MSEIDSDKIAIPSLDLPRRAICKSAKVDRRCPPPIVEPIPNE